MEIRKIDPQRRLKLTLFAFGVSYSYEINSTREAAPAACRRLLWGRSAPSHLILKRDPRRRLALVPLPEIHAEGLNMRHGRTLAIRLSNPVSIGLGRYM